MHTCTLTHIDICIQKKSSTLLICYSLYEQEKNERKAVLVAEGAAVPKQREASNFLFLRWYIVFHSLGTKTKLDPEYLISLEKPAGEKIAHV